MIKVIIVGAAGRMGKRLVALTLADSELRLTGATEYSGSPFLGQDAGIVAGAGETGVKISADISALLGGADVVIDFSTGPVVENAALAVSKNVAVVIGSTGLSAQQKSEIANLAKSGGRIVMSSNMSVGVNLLSELCASASKILGDAYDIEIVEMHHRNKKDAPSGTALLLADAIAKAKGIALSDCAVYGRNGNVGERPRGEIGIHAVRGGDVVGDHTVIFAAEGERIELVHKASNRDTFAKGAIRAAKFIASARPGIYDMRDVLGLNQK